jgi:hypothetical protein
MSDLGVGYHGGLVQNAVIGAAGRGLICPIIVPAPVRVKRLFTHTGATLTANIDIGIYRQNLSLVVSTGAQPLAGASQLMFLDITDTDLPAGNYYLAISASTNTGQVGQISQPGVFSPYIGCAQMATAHPLPATFVPARSSFIPFVGMEIGRIV